MNIALLSKFLSDANGQPSFIRLGGAAILFTVCAVLLWQAFVYQPDEIDWIGPIGMVSAVFVPKVVQRKMEK